MTLRELGYSIQDAFANVGDWFQEMFWIALYGSWVDWFYPDSPDTQLRAV